MIADYYTLFHLTHDLAHRLRGLQLAEAFTQSRQEAVFGFAPAPPAGRLGSAVLWLIVSCDPSRNYLYARATFARAKRNTLDLFPSAVGETIEDVIIEKFDRQISLVFRSGRRLVVQMFRSSANILLLERDGSIAGTFLKRHAAVPPAVRQQNDPSSPEVFAESFHSVSAQDSRAALKGLYPRLSSALLNEALARANLPPRDRPDSLSDEHLGKLFQAVSTMIKELRDHPAPRVYRAKDGACTFSLIPLTSMAGIPVEEFASLHDAIRTRLAGSSKEHATADRQSRLLRYLRTELQRIERAVQKIHKDMPEPGEEGQHETAGKLLMAHISDVRTGAREVILLNDFSPLREPIRIALQPALNAAQNAERYFSKAKKARKAREELLERTEQPERKRALLQSDLRLVEGVEDDQQLEGIAARYPQLKLKTTASGRAKPEREHPLFRVFHVAGGFEVLAGKNSANNDLLTLKHARPNDLWFHARGSSGSHVVLRVGTGKGEPSKRAIEQAAAIAAFYSGMKNAKTVPVAVTLRKYVRKPRGAPAGTVTIEREKLLFVEPELPTSEI